MLSTARLKKPNMFVCFLIHIKLAEKLKFHIHERKIDKGMHLPLYIN